MGAHAAQWPVANPSFTRFPPNDYATYALTTANGYHTGMDIVGSANPCAYNTQVVAGVEGTVALLQPLGPCATPPIGSCPGAGCPDQGLGNSVTVLGSDGVYYTYGHLDSIDAGLQVGQTVSPATPIGIMGNSSYGVPRHGFCPGVPACGGGQDFVPHVHFESKSAPFIGYGYISPAPDFAAYRDAVPQIYPAVPITPIVVRVLPSPLFMQGVPDYQGFVFPSGSQSAAGNAGERYVAFEQVGSWYHIYVPPIRPLPTELWIPTALTSCAYGRCCANGQCVVTDTAPLPVVRVVSPPADNGVIARTLPSMTAPQVARLWDGDMYVTVARQLPQPGETCTGEWFQLQAAQPPSPGAPVVWVCSRTNSKVFLEVREPCDANGECTSPGICQSGPGTCTPTGCVYPVTTGAPCDDGDVCTGADVCSETALCSGSAACTPSPTWTASATATRTATGTRTPTRTRTSTATATATSASGPVASATPTASATSVSTATATATRTATATPTQTSVQVCQSFATGVCCDSADGTNCKSPAVVCAGNADCSTQGAYSICAGASGDDNGVASVSNSLYDNVTFGQCFPAGTLLGMSRSRNPNGTYYNNIGLVQWNTAALPDDATITSATFTAVVVSKTNTDARSLQGEWYDWGTACDGGDWTLTAGNNAFSTPISSVTASNAANTFTLAGVGNVNVGGRTSLRLNISGGAATGVNSVQIAAWDHTTLVGPRLQVCYELATPTPVVSSTPTPTAPVADTPTATSTALPSDTPTATSTALPSDPPTATSTAIASATSTATATTSSDTPPPSATATSTPTATNTEPATATFTPAFTSTPTIADPPTATMSATPTRSFTGTATPVPSASATATATATPAIVCTTFATGVCCDGADGTNCKIPSVVCDSDTDCSGQGAFAVCAGASGDDNGVSSLSNATYGNVTFSQCFPAATLLGMSRSRNPNGTYYNNVGLVQWNTAALPDNAILTSATFTATVVSKSNADARSLQGEWYDWGAACDASDWTLTAGNTAFSTPVSSINASNAANTFTLTGVGNVNVSGRTALRLNISGGAATGVNSVQIAAWDHTTLAGPRLQACYVLPTPTPALP